MTDHLSLSTLAQFLDAYPWTGYTKPKRFSFTKKREPGSNFVWITRSFTDVTGGTASVVEIDETYEVYLYTADADAWKCLLNLLNKYPGQVFFDNFSTDLSRWTAGGTVAISDGKVVIDAAGESLQKTGSITGTAARIEFDLEWTGTPGFQIITYGTGDVQLFIIQMASGNLVFTTTGNNTLVTSPTAGTTYNIKVDNFTTFGGATLKADVSVNGTKVLDQTAIYAAPMTAITAILFSRVSGSYSIDNVIIDGTTPGQYQPRKYFNTKAQHLGPSPFQKNEEVWKFTFKYNKLEVVT